VSSYVLKKLTWPEIEERLSHAELGIVPTGSTEQHGPHGTLAVDAARAERFCEMLAEGLAPRALVAPTIDVGVSHHHLGFPGTMTLKPETFIQVCVDLAWSLQQHGLNQVLFVNGHGGNRPALGIAALRVRQELGMKTAWVDCGGSMAKDWRAEQDVSEVTGHACEIEMSQSLVLCPEVVRMDQLQPGDLTDAPYGKRPWWGSPAWMWDEISKNGALGDATRLSPEMGKELNDLVLGRVQAFVEEYFFGEQ